MSSQGAINGPHFGPIDDSSDDDLPRTFRREKEARAREARERAAQERAAAPSLPAGTEAPYRQPEPQIYSAPTHAPDLSDLPVPASVRRLDIPFVHLMKFFLKAVLAAIPALFLLGVILWMGGAALQAFFPDLVKMKILISFPN